MMETIVLTDIRGIMYRSGTDEHGNTWMEFDVDEFADQSQGTCVICGATLDSGWMCMDGGEEVCDGHVILSGSKE